jgi:hypothetical protein
MVSVTVQDGHKENRWIWRNDFNRELYYSAIVLCNSYRFPRPVCSSICINVAHSSYAVAQLVEAQR